MVLLLYLFLSNIIRNILSQDYCDLDTYCDSCDFCGLDNSDYCSCEFYNSYCLQSDSSEYFNSKFLLGYDGCITSNDDYTDICGSSTLSIKNGETKNINLKSTSETDFFCFYSFKAADEENKLTLVLNPQGEQDFNIYIISYLQDSSYTISSGSSSYITSKFELDKSNIEKVSIYIDIRNGQNLDQLSLSLLYNEYNNDENESDSSITKIIKSKSTSSANTWIIIGIIIGVILLLLIIVTSIILYRKFKSNKKGRTTNSNNTFNTISNTTNNYQYMSVVNNNKQKLNMMFSTELRPTIFNKSNMTNDCYNCTICMEKFVDNSSLIVTTKCNHSFHENCFKNWTYKNIICPKCPNCNYLILGPLDNNLQNITLPSSIDYTMQTNQNATTTIV